MKFYDKISPVFAGKKYDIPTPTLCPDCRKQRRLSFRNERILYKKECDFSKQSVVSIYSPDKDYITYEQNIWWSDKYSPFDYGIDFDFSRPFFEQFQELQKAVPRISILNGFSDNADYGNHSYYNKNSYYVNSCGYVEDSYYCVTSTNCKNCVDCLKLTNSQVCYEAINSDNCFHCFYVLNCNNCSYLYLGEDCIGCKNCLGCKGLNNSEYYILNKPYSKQDYQKEYDKIFLNNDSKKDFINKYKKLRLTVPSKNLNIINSDNIAFSDNILNSSNLYGCFDCYNGVNLKYCTEMYYQEVENCYDYDIWGENSSYIYEVHCFGNGSKILFSNIIWGGHNIYYCDNCLNNPKDCFGCVGLKNNEQYCIFNKQYSKQEYEKLVSQIIEHMQNTGEWGEFFPSTLSPFGYNETVAMEYYPLTKKLATEKGFKWSDYEQPFPKVQKIIPANKLPENIKNIPDDILNRAIQCEITNKLFKITKQELEFYRKHNLPIPKKHFNQRHLERMQQRNPRKIFNRKCDKCNKNINSSYSPIRKEIVYCEECYDKEVY
ncbi:MAG: hypothetical protein PHN31_02315 [Candidatus Gracilibacteria bacterium]|nr:hypothetical protein [Candidatus Gracilibacteria bacterium]